MNDIHKHIFTNNFLTLTLTFQEPLESQIEEYWFICDRWLAKGEDDGKIVRELVPTDEKGNAIKSGLQGKCLPITHHTSLLSTLSQ